MTFEQLIHNKIGVLSAGQKKVAEYILQNLDSFSYATLAKLSKEISVSETTIIRLSYSLGFDSFSEMQQKVREEILSVPQSTKEEILENGNFYQAVFAKEIKVLENWASSLDQSLLDRIVDTLINSDQILVVGARSSHSAAIWFGSILNRLLGNATVISEFYDSRFDLLTNITEKTSVLCITYARYTKWTYLYADIAKKNGAKLISITDSVNSPVFALSDESIIVDSNMDEMGFNSFVCMYGLFDALIAKIQKKKHTHISSRLKNIEKLYSDFDMFFE